ncbi:hypothetical protein PoB_003039200 [Plakobranchus ocellatus]|uniref:Uncharacterized protein n=1 Tax=Plakobranchus ocellatus TaxID=259542 RepID=A0AAV4AA76_9GAST|nr:hypothetical protein PoB_003039200 [Plakobranchus ocellatus]
MHADLGATLSRFVMDSGSVAQIDHTGVSSQVPENACVTAQNAPFTLPSKLKRKGRPKQSKSRKCFQTKKIERESGEFFIVDARYMLSKLVSEDIVEKVLSKEMVVSRDMLDELEMLAMVADCKLDVFKDFFNEDCWSYFQNLVLSKRKQLL